MTRVVVTAEADADAIAILDYLHREAGVRVAERYKLRFEETLARLADLPEIGPPRPALGAHTRIGIVQPYLLIYDFTPPDDNADPASHSAWQTKHYACSSGSLRPPARMAQPHGPALTPRPAGLD